MTGRPPRRPLPWWAGAQATPLLALAVLVLGIVAGVAAAGLQARPWTSTSSVLVVPATTGSEEQELRASQLVNMETEAQVVLSQAVLREAASVLGVEPDALTAAVTVQVPAGTQVLAVTASATSPTTASRRAGAVTAAYLRLREAQTQALLDEQRAASAARVEQLSAELRRVSAATSSDESSRLLREAQVDALRASLVQERTSLYRLEGTTPSPGSVIGPPTDPEQGGLPPVLLGVAGLVTGAVGGVFLPWLALAARRTVQSAPQVSCLGATAQDLRRTPLVLPHEALLRHRLHTGDRLRVVGLRDGPWLDAVVDRLVLRLGAEDQHGALVGTSPSPLELEWSDGVRWGDVFVLVVNQGDLLSDVDQALEAIAAAGHEIVAVLVGRRPREHRPSAEQRAAEVIAAGRAVVGATVPAAGHEPDAVPGTDGGRYEPAPEGVAGVGRPAGEEGVAAEQTSATVHGASRLR